MASRATITGRVKSGGLVHINFDDGSQLSDTLEGLKVYVRELDTNIENAKRAAIGRALAQDENLDNISSVQGKAVIFDLTQPNPIRIDPNATGTFVAQADQRG